MLVDAVPVYALRCSGGFASAGLTSTCDCLLAMVLSSCILAGQRAVTLPHEHTHNCMEFCMHLSPGISILIGFLHTCYWNNVL